MRSNMSHEGTGIQEDAERLALVHTAMLAFVAGEPRRGHLRWDWNGPCQHSWISNRRTFYSTIFIFNACNSSINIAICGGHLTVRVRLSKWIFQRSWYTWVFRAVHDTSIQLEDTGK